LVFLTDLVENSLSVTFEVHAEVDDYLETLSEVFNHESAMMTDDLDDTRRRMIMDELGQAGSNFRWKFYQYGLSGAKVRLDRKKLLNFLHLVRQTVEHTLKVNHRSDELYHSYNILSLKSESAAVSPLYEMLEGQVAILSSGVLDGKESLTLLDSLHAGPLYRADQHSFILYPEREVKGFVERNQITSSRANKIKLFVELTRYGDNTLIRIDENGNYHFAGTLRNIRDVRQVLEVLRSNEVFKDSVEKDYDQVEQLYEDTFHHDQFTGRSGTFFAYEGLGSIYWHMVSKLLLAVQETIERTCGESSTNRLIEHYRNIRAGQCFNKSVLEYGAFPTDPYSHSPAGKGARQPGMTGMVKEEIIARQAELGFGIENGCITFKYQLFSPNEFLRTPTSFRYLGVSGQREEIELPVGSLAYTVCQVPVILAASDHAALCIYNYDGSRYQIEGNKLDESLSKSVFQREGLIHHIEVQVPGLVG
jgi:hypothetical protein